MINMRKSLKQRVRRRLSIIEGQVRALTSMVERDEYCIDIIRQAEAAKQALSAVQDVMLENHLSTHVADAMKRGEIAKATREILSVFKVAKGK